MKRDLTYITVIILVIVVMLIREGCNKRETDKLVAEISGYKTEAQTFKTKDGLVVSTNVALPLETQNQIKSLMASNDTLKQWMAQFKNIKGGVVVKETTIVKEVAVPFERQIPCDFKPFHANKITKDFQLYTTVSNTGFTLDTLKMPNTATILIGEKRSGFLNLKTKLVVDVNNSNPYMKTSNIAGYVYQPTKKWYERTWVHVLAGATVGVLVDKYGNQAISLIKFP